MCIDLHISNCKIRFFKIQVVFATFHYGVLVSSKGQIGFYIKEMDFVFDDLLKHMFIFISLNLLHMNFINFSNQKLGLNTYFSNGFNVLLKSICF
jgi:hypothetical protein